MNREDGTIQQAPKTSHSKGRGKILTIGIDPASEGAATILLNGEVVCALAWRKRTRQKKRVYEITEARQGYETFSFIVKSGGEIGAAIFNLPEVQRAVEDGYEVDLVVEDTYVGRNMRTALIVARFGGLVAGTVEAGIGKPANWVRAASWRANLLNLSHFTKREKAKRSSLSLIPNLLCGMSVLIDKLGAIDHLTDSAGVALWHYRTNHEDGDQE